MLKLQLFSSKNDLIMQHSCVVVYIYLYISPYIYIYIYISLYIYIQNVMFCSDEKKYKWHHIYMSVK